MGRLGVDEQLVDGLAGHVVEQVQVNAQPDGAEQLHRLLGRDHGGAAECADGPRDPVLLGLFALADQHLAGLPLVLKDHGDDLADFAQHPVLGPAEGDLVRDLVQVAAGPAALAVQAADHEVDLLERLEHFFDLLGNAERRQVEHDAGAHPGADVGRAGGEVAELVVEGVGQAGFEGVVEPVDDLPGVVEGQPAAQDLQAQVVLLVDHDADRLAGVEGDAAGAVQDVGQFAADELALDQELAVEGEQARRR